MLKDAKIKVEFAEKLKDADKHLVFCAAKHSSYDQKNRGYPVLRVAGLSEN